MKNHLSLIILLFSLFCTGQQNKSISKDIYTSAIKNAVDDFREKSSLLKNDNIFSVSYKILNSNFIQINIIGNSNKFYIDGDKPINRLPTNYLEFNNKIFYWYDDNEIKLNTSIISKLQEYGLIEYNADIIEYSRDDKKKSISYYFCTKDLTNYKKVKSNSLKIKIPKLSCK
ncbi:hypothetical protein [Chryseobacterium sp. YIM B08800]|uniref:hypothetical protein n=1 Tax=Chryseobacterium sp. YIM B08800 TaxID=2984136 RepID=UPI0022408AB7|nr:hypothetical protein [Chryseobacterium sp. YIM B08800]